MLTWAGINKGITRYARDLRFCDPGGIQTPNLLIRSQMLYSVKLRDLLEFAAVNIVKFFFSLILTIFNSEKVSLQLYLSF